MAYTYNGEQFPSVTVICDLLDKSGALMGWALNCYERKLNDLIASGVEISEAITTAKREYSKVSDEALDIGKQVHDAIEKYVKYKKDLRGTLKPEVEHGFLAFLEWEEKEVDCWLESEIKMVHYSAGYAGTLDAIFKNKKGETVLVDFKTSKAIYDTNWLQVSAYKKARESLSGEYSILFERGETALFNYDLPSIKIDKVAVLRLDKETGIPEYKERDPKKCEMDYLAFESLVSFFYHFKKRLLKNNHLVKSIWKK